MNGEEKPEEEKRRALFINYNKYLTVVVFMCLAILFNSIAFLAATLSFAFARRICVVR